VKEKRTKKTIGKVESGTTTKRWVISIVITSVVSLIVGGVLAPYVGAYFTSVLSSKPDIQIVRGEDTSAIVPMWGTNWVLIKVVVRNTGTSAEQNVQVRLEVESPWTFNGSTWYTYTFSSISGNTAQMIVINCQNPSVSQLQHGTFQTTVRVIGATKSWDTAVLTQSW
jgi:hypothetical protein